MSDETALRRVQAALEKALKLKAAGDYGKAVEALRAAEKDALPPGSTETRRVLGEIRFAIGDAFERSGDLTAARAAYDSAVQCDPRNKRAIVKHVEHSFAAAAPEDATLVPYYIDYVALGRSKRVRIDVLKRLQTLLRIRLVDRPETLAWRMGRLEELNRAAPEVNFPKLYLGRAHYILGNWRRSIEFLAAISGSAQETHDLLNMLGRAHEKLQEYAEARAAYESSLRRVPGQSGIHFRLGRLQLKAAESTADFDSNSNS